MTPLNEILEQMKKRCEAATPGPWIFCDAPGDLYDGTIICIRKKKYVCTEIQDWEYSEKFSNDDLLKFIAKSRTDVPKLIQALEVARLKSYGGFNKREGGER